MRLSHFALACTIILLGITSYLAWEAQDAARGASVERDLLRRQLEAREAAKPIAPISVAEIPPVAPPVASASAPADVAPLGSGLMPGTPSPAPAAAPLTAQQKQVLGMIAVAQITEVRRDEGFAVINAGQNKNLQKGTKFDVRRKESVVGRVILTDAIEANEAVVDIDPAYSLRGVQIEVGDELIVPISK